MNAQRTSLTAVLVVALSGFAGPSCVRSSSEPHPTPQGADAGSVVAASPPPPTLDTRTLGWDLGKLYAYQLKLVSTMSMGSPDNSFDFDLTGIVRLATVTATPELATLYATIADVKAVSRIPDSQEEFDKIAAQVQKAGCFFTLSGGRLRELRVPQGAAPTVINVYREVASAFQFARPLQELTRYTAEEYDTTGKYVAEYEFEPNTRLWQKKKQKYLELLTPTLQQGNIPARILPEVVASRGTIRLLADGRPDAIETSEELVMQSAQFSLRSTNTLSLEGGTSEPARQLAPDWTALVAATSRIAADEPYVVEGMDQSLEDQRVSGLTFEKAVEGLEQLGGGKVEPANSAGQTAMAHESKLFIALAAILRTQPKTIPLAVRKIRSRSPIYRTLIDALASASSPEAQAALVQLMKSKTIDRDARTDIIASLTRTPNPDEVSIAAFKALLADNPASTQALYGLGTYSRRLRDKGKVKEAKEISELVAAQLALASSPGRLADVLRGIANSGYAGALPRVLPFLTSEDEGVRVAAVRALQSMHDTKVDELIAARLETDPSRQVRLSAVESAKLRQPSDTLARAFSRAATNAEADAHVRYAAVQVMIGWMPRGRGELRVALEKVARDDQEQRIRELATNAL